MSFRTSLAWDNGSSNQSGRQCRETPVWRHCAIADVPHLAENSAVPAYTPYLPPCPAGTPTGAGATGSPG